MTIRAIDVHNPDNRIEDAIVISSAWGDDTPSFFAVRPDEVLGYHDAWLPARVEILSEREAARANWVGIKITSIHGVAAWGRANLEIH